jgi:hypothetical protein
MAALSLRDVDLTRSLSRDDEAKRLAAAQRKAR